jgi:spermidine synthase
MGKTALILVFCAAGIWQVVSVSSTAIGGSGRLVHKKDSLYHRIFVYRDRSVVTLQFGRRPNVPMQSQVDLSNLRRHMLEYTMLSFCGLLYQPEPERMLVLGLGGGVIPREMRYYLAEVEIDVAEIDPEVPQIAREYFGFRQDDKLKVHVDDGRMFVKKRLGREGAAKYDIVILDAFNGDYIPFHLMTKEFLEEVKGVLAEDGVVIANVFHDNRLFDAEFKTFLTVFGRCQVFVGGYSMNAMLAAPGPAGSTLSNREAVGRARTLQGKYGLAFDLVTVAKQLRARTRPDPRAEVLTDDRAPVNWLRAQERR